MRCSCCHCWFDPHPRVRNTQRTCGAEACRKEQRQRTQAAWRSQNRGYGADWRLRRQALALERAAKERDEAQKAGRPLPVEADWGPAVPPGPGILAEVPWAFAKDAIGAQGAVLIEFLVRLGHRVAKDAMRAQWAEITAQFARVGGIVAEDAIGAGKGADP